MHPSPHPDMDVAKTRADLFPTQRGSGQCIKGFLKRIFPAFDQRCMVCGTVLPPDVPHTGNGSPPGVCHACRIDLTPRPGGVCPRCGLMFGLPTGTVSLCLDCRLAPPPWSEAFFFNSYEGLLKEMVLRFKFNAQLGLALILREMLVTALTLRGNPFFDLTVPVPLHSRKLRSRGFNQSLELAKGIPRSLSGGIAAQALTRTRHTPAQHTLPRAQRMHNLKDAFLADPVQIRDRTILLVDDILTTGSTARAATTALLQAGARKVCLAVLARA